MTTGHIVIHIGAEVEIKIPASWRFKHYDRDETEAVVGEFVKKLGHEYFHLEEADSGE